MNWDRIAGKWTEFKGRVRERWNKLTDDDLARIEGKREQLVGVLQARYGWVREQAERQIKDFESAIFAKAGKPSPGPQSTRSESMDDEDEESMTSR